MREACTVLWDDAPWQPEDILVSTLRLFLMPAFVKEPVLVPSKVLQLQSRNWYLQNNDVFNTKQPTDQAVADMSTYYTADEGSMQQSHVPGSGGSCSHVSGSSVASSWSTPTREPAPQHQTWQNIAVNKNKLPSHEALCDKLFALVNKPATAEEPHTIARSLAGLPAAWLQRLVQQHLEPADRLQLFQTNRAMAAAVMHHAARPTLSLVQTVSDTASSIERLRSVRDIRKSLVSLANNNLHLQVCRYTLCSTFNRVLFHLLPKQNVTQLTLVAMTLQPQQLSQVKGFSNLHVLTLGPYLVFDPSTSNETTELPQLDTWLPASCTKLQLFQQGTLSCVQHLLPLLAPRITQLVIKPLPAVRKTDPQVQKLVLSHLPCFTALTHIAVPWELDGDEPSMGAILSITTLTHVDVNGLDASIAARHWEYDETDFNSKRVINIAWQQLIVRGQCRLWDLMHLTLEGVQHLVIDGILNPKLRWPAEMNEWHVAQLAKCPRLQLLPCMYTFKGHRWQEGKVQQTAEQLRLPMAEMLGNYTAAFVRVCMQSLEGGLMLPELYHKIPDDNAVADLIRLLPPTVDAVLLSKMMPQYGNREHVCEQLVAALPVTVKKFVLESPSDGRELCRNAALTAKYLAATGHPAVLYVLLAPHQPVLDGLQQAAAAHPSRVRVIIGEADSLWSYNYSRPRHGFHDIWQD